MLEHGTGALNIEACRISTGEDLVIWQEAEAAKGKGIFGPKKGSTTGKAGKFKNESGGRWPANVVHDGSPEVMAEFATQSERMGMHSAGSARAGGEARQKGAGGMFGVGNFIGNGTRLGDDRTAARFFYCAKASKRERNEAGKNKHPTVKPIALMAWLIKLITPKGRKVLDPFMGSGTTGFAALDNGFAFLGIERSRSYYRVARKRIRLHAEHRNRGLKRVLTSDCPRNCLICVRACKLSNLSKPSPDKCFFNLLVRNPSHVNRKYDP